MKFEKFYLYNKIVLTKIIANAFKISKMSWSNSLQKKIAQSNDRNRLRFVWKVTHAQSFYTSKSQSLRLTS